MAKKEINIEEMIGKIYFQIATWHNTVPDFNDEENKTRLYSASYKILETILQELNMPLLEGEDVGEEVEATPAKKERDEKLERLEKQMQEISEMLGKQSKKETEK